MKNILFTLIAVLACHFYVDAQCSSTITNFPYSESFESSNTPWGPITSNDGCTGDWVKKSGSTASTGTGPSSAKDGSFYLYTEASSGCSNREMIIMGPCFDLTGASSADLGFGIHMYGSNMGTLRCEISSNGGSSWTPFWDLTGQWQTSNSANWLSIYGSLDAYIGNVIQVRFRGTTGSSYRSDMAIDEIFINVENAPCPLEFNGGDNVSVPGPGGYNISKIVETTGNWTATSNASWLVVNTPSGSGSGQLNFNINSNPTSQTRTGQITVSCGGSTITLTVTHTGNGSAYCSSQGGTFDEWINYVRLGNMPHTSGDNGGYADFTSISQTISVGEGIPIFMNTGYSGTQYDEYWRIWVDYNEDGDFTDANEEVYNKFGSPGFGFTLYPPAGVSPGSKRLRVSMKYGSPPSPCEEFSFGEVEDYTLNIVAAKEGISQSTISTAKMDENLRTVPTANVVETFRNYPNPFKGTTTIEYTLTEDAEVTLVITDITGRQVAQLENETPQGKGIHTVSLDATLLPTGIYFYTLRFGDEQLTKQMVITK